MPRKNTNKNGQEKKTKTKGGERGKKKPKPTSDTPVATTEGEFLEALRKEFFACLAEQGTQKYPSIYFILSINIDFSHPDVGKIKGMIDREFKAQRRLEKVKHKRFDPFAVFKQSGLGRLGGSHPHFDLWITTNSLSVAFDIVTTHASFPERRSGAGGRHNKQGHSPQGRGTLLIHSD